MYKMHHPSKFGKDRTCKNFYNYGYQRVLAPKTSAPPASETFGSNSAFKTVKRIIIIRYTNYSKVKIEPVTM